MIHSREHLKFTTSQIKENALGHNTVYSTSMVNLIITIFETTGHRDSEILALLTHELGKTYADNPITLLSFSLDVLLLIWTLLQMAFI
jgi:hypothetical protein